MISNKLIPEPFSHIAWEGIYQQEDQRCLEYLGNAAQSNWISFETKAKFMHFLYCELRNNYTISTLDDYIEKRCGNFFKNDEEEFAIWVSLNNNNHIKIAYRKYKFSYSNKIWSLFELDAGKTTEEYKTTILDFVSKLREISDKRFDKSKE